MCPNYDYRCSNPECLHEEVHYLPMSECTSPQVCPLCGGVEERAYDLGAPAVHDSTNVTHVIVPPEYKHMIRSAKADHAWKGTKDPKKRKELKEAAAELQRHKT